MAYIINTGLLTSICAIGALVTVGSFSFADSMLEIILKISLQFATMPQSYVFFALFESYSKRKRDYFFKYSKFTNTSHSLF